MCLTYPPTTQSSPLHLPSCSLCVCPSAGPLLLPVLGLKGPFSQAKTTVQIPSWKCHAAEGTMLYGTAAPGSVLSLCSSSLLTTPTAPPERVEKRAHLCLWCTCGEGAAFPRDPQRCSRGAASANPFLGLVLLRPVPHGRWEHLPLLSQPFSSSSRWECIFQSHKCCSRG